MREISHGTIYYYMKDGLGSIRQMVHSDGEVVQRYKYSSYGGLEIIDEDGDGEFIENPMTFTGREWDAEIGLFYYRARYMDPRIGRFLQKDPHPGSFTNPITVVNSYIYVGNSPNVLRDPSGKGWFGWFTAIVGAAFGIGIGLAVAAASGWFAGVAAGWGMAMLFDPSFYAGLTMATIDFFGLNVIRGFIWLADKDVKFVYPRARGGGIFMMNTFYTGSDAFAVGPFAFVPEGQRTGDVWHETGHFSQWADRGGWVYGIQGLGSVFSGSSAADPSGLDKDADLRAGTCDYPVVTNPYCR